MLYEARAQQVPKAHENLTIGRGKGQVKELRTGGPGRGLKIADARIDLLAAS